MEALLFVFGVGLYSLAFKSLTIVLFEYPISNKEFPMIKGGSRFAPLFIVGSLDIQFLISSWTFQPKNIPPGIRDPNQGDSPLGC